LQYSTSEIMTSATIGDRDIAVLYGDQGSDGETVLRYGSEPTVTATGGTVDDQWDPATGDLRLNYTHKGLIRVSITGDGQRPLLLLLADKATAKTFWRQDTASGPVLVRGTHLLRTATSLHGGHTLALTGDNARRQEHRGVHRRRPSHLERQDVGDPAGTGSLTGKIPRPPRSPADADRLEARRGVARSGSPVSTTPAGRWPTR
jgi:hypothetical protein